MDESGFRIGGKTQWLHVLSSKEMTHYRSSPKRGAHIKDVQGVIVHDHFKPYFTIDNVKHGLCNAHHLRELKALEEVDKEPWAPKMSKLLKWLSKIKAPPLKMVFTFYPTFRTFF
ncbi:hypothetical protein CCPUN_08650 [Cardinium endosymbiont of Culicoides punctatus]|nr:hypothetical protein CCPUN_08650 [Cardinium endosymbiont of Culicoides punctatus]